MIDTTLVPENTAVTICIALTRLNQGSTRRHMLCAIVACSKLRCRHEPRQS